MAYICAIIIGYLLGCVNSAYFLAKAKGFDIRTRGSFSAGASNAKVTMGWPYFFIVLAYDLCKAALAVFIIDRLFPGIYPAKVLAGCCAVVGHCYPFYLNWQGGKGFASYIGLMACLDLLFTACCSAVCLLVSFLANWIVAGTLVNIISFPIYMAVFKKADWLSVLFISLTTLLIIWKHRVNFVKLVNHKEIGINGNYVGTKIKAEVAPDQKAE